MEGSCECIEKVVADIRQGGLPAGGLGDLLTNPHPKNLKMSRTSHKSLGIGLILRELRNRKGI
jgi:hypothetical protein